jgi:O-antigen/teichoic acid export membrane protein
LARDGNGSGDGKASPVELGHGRQMAGGMLKLLAVQALALALGFLISAFLTRKLGAELYGLFTVTATIVIWVELSATVMFGQTTVKFLAEADDWFAVASTLAQAQIVVGLGATVLLAVAAPALASWLKSPELTPYFLLFALDIPLFALNGAHRSTLVGREAYGKMALVGITYWLSRLGLVLLLVGLGLSLTGAILANIGASLLQLTVARTFVRPALLARPAFPLRRLASYALPLFFYSVGIRMFRQIDLLVVKALAGAPEAAGYYGAAQNLTILPLTMFALSLTPLLLATLPRLLRTRRDGAARNLAAQAMRLVWCLLPLAALVAGSAPEIVDLVYGSPFLPAAPVVALLVFAGVATALISVIAAVLTAAGRPGWTFALTGPLLPLALGAHLLLVPRFGSLGAAVGTTVLAWLDVGAMAWAVYWHCGASLAPATIIRTGLITLLAYALSSAWHTRDGWVILELLGLAAVVLLGLFLLGELTRQDLAFARSLLKRQRSTSWDTDLAS